MTTIHTEANADPSLLQGKRVAVVGYGNQGRSWALNLRDSGVAVQVCARADASREQATQDGFDVGEIPEASDADILCVLIPDDVIPALEISPRPDALSIVASGYTLAYDRFTPPGDQAMIAPRMLGPEVRRCYQEGVGFITAIGVQRDATGDAWPRTLAVARAIGGLAQGAIELTPAQEALLDLAVEQVLSPALTHVSQSFVMTLLQKGIPLEAIQVELFLSGEVERNYRLLREEGYCAQLEYHSPTSQYGQLSRRGSYDHLDFSARMNELTEHIESGAFADEWDAEGRAGYPKLTQLKHEAAGPAMQAMEEVLRSNLGLSRK